MRGAAARVRQLRRRACAGPAPRLRGKTAAPSRARAAAPAREAAAVEAGGARRRPWREREGPGGLRRPRPPSPPREHCPPPVPSRRETSVRRQCVPLLPVGACVRMRQKAAMPPAKHQRREGAPALPALLQRSDFVWVQEQFPSQPKPQEQPSSVQKFRCSLGR
ncbi:serine/arginine repetitive matrix protein 1-like [Prinia subflava]|uniref:serine/arginine repetitive matrix protein 1-like n=1 Tax=Prinia subflava TaxID=208062 RepID=UPI002FE0C460